MIHALWAILSGAIGGIVSGYLIQHYNELQNRKKFSLLGISIVGYLMAQLDLGIDILNTLAGGTCTNKQLPNSAWNGMQTIPQEVLLRVVSVAPRCPGDCHNEFLFKDMLVHCNNYFVYICGNINSMLAQCAPFLSQQAAATKYLEDAKKVKSMLAEIKKSLEKNSERCLPK